MIYEILYCPSSSDKWSFWDSNLLDDFHCDEQGEKGFLVGYSNYLD